MDKNCTKCPNCAGTLENSSDGRTKNCPFCCSIFEIDKERPIIQENPNVQQQFFMTFTYSVKLTTCREKIKAIKEYRELTGLGLKESKEAIDSCPVVIAKQKSEAEANGIANIFRKIGCSVELMKEVGQTVVPTQTINVIYTRSPEDIAKEKCLNYHPFSSTLYVEAGPALNISGSKKYKAAKNAFNIPDGEDVYVILDGTVFASCKKGFALCRTGIYYNGDGGKKGRIPWSGFGNVTIEKKGRVIHFDGAQFIASADAKTLFPLLQSIHSEISGQERG